MSLLKEFLPSIATELSFFICLIAFFITAAWLIIKKNDGKGWKILIPGYGIYVFMKSIDSTTQFWGVLIMGFIQWLINVIWPNNSVILAALFLLIDVLFHLFKCINAGKHFGRSAWFIVGLFFAYPIFLGILAFDKSVPYHYLRPSINENKQSATINAYTNIVEKIFQYLAGTCYTIYSILIIYGLLNERENYDLISIIMCITYLILCIPLAIGLFTEKKKIAIIAILGEILIQCCKTIYISWYSFGGIAWLIKYIMYYNIPYIAITALEVMAICTKRVSSAILLFIFCLTFNVLKPLLAGIAISSSWFQNLTIAAPLLVACAVLANKLKFKQNDSMGL